MAKKKRQSMAEKTRAKADAAANRGGSSLYNLPEGVEEFKPKAKTYELDILPYEVTVDTHPEVEKGELWYQRTIWVHYGIGEVPRICPRTVNKPCPACEERKALMKEGDSDNDELIEQLRPRERELYNVIDLNDEDKGVQLWNHSYYLFGEKLDEEIRESDDDTRASFAELEGGSTLSIRFKEKKLGNNPFYEATRIDFTERDDYDEDILEQVVNLDEILNIPSYEQLQKELHGAEASKDDDEDEEEEKSKKRKGRGKAKGEEKGKKRESKSSGKKREKAKPKKEKEKDEDEEPEMPEDWEALDALETDELKAVAEHLELSTRGKDDKLKERIAEALDIEQESDKEDDEEAEEKPKTRKKGKASSSKQQKSSRGKKKSDDDEKPKRGKRKSKAKDEDEDEKPKKGRGKAKSKKKAKDDDEEECPAGGEFGVDTDEHDECEECPIWADCREKKDEEEE